MRDIALAFRKREVWFGNSSTFLMFHLQISGISSRRLRAPSDFVHCYARKQISLILNELLKHHGYEAAAR